MERVFATTALVFAGVSAVIALAYLIWRPRLNGTARLWLLAGIGILPLGAATTGNVANVEVSSKRVFCASCHTMDRMAKDAADPESTTLAAMHSRNKVLGEESCYNCHRDYSDYGAVYTKLGGMRHVWAQFRGNTKNPKLYRPFANATCMGCHSTKLTGWQDEPEHQAVIDDIKSGEVSCASEGCHGPAHPPAPDAEKVGVLP